MFVLEVMSGPLDGKTWTFDQEITIGRDDAVAVACITIDRYISRKHAKLCAEGKTLRLVDLQSRNGTKVDGQPVLDQAVLELGKPFVVGRTTLRVIARDGTGAEAAP
jgi:pSer/pThr/pTyr-binding forkhead associated (FHA) protein